jgi:hypothetical protein
LPSNASLAKAAKLRGGVKRSERPLAKHLPVATTTTEDLLLALETHHLILALHRGLLLMTLNPVLDSLEFHSLRAKTGHVVVCALSSGEKPIGLGGPCLTRGSRCLCRHLLLRSLHGLSHLSDSCSLLWRGRCRSARNRGLSTNRPIVRITKCPKAKVSKKLGGRLAATHEFRQHSTAH